MRIQEREKESETLIGNADWMATIGKQSTAPKQSPPPPPPRNHLGGQCPLIFDAFILYRRLYYNHHH